MKKSPPLPIRFIRLDLVEALGELEELWARIQIAAFGKILAKELDSRKKYADWLAKRLPLTDSALFYSLDHAYHHLNFAWNCRRAPEERVRACAAADFVRWSRFPTGAPFLDLQPLPRRAKGPPREAGLALVRPTCILHAYAQLAVRHLGLLRDMATAAGTLHRGNLRPPPPPRLPRHGHPLVLPPPRRRRRHPAHPPPPRALPVGFRRCGGAPFGMMKPGRKLPSAGWSCPSGTLKKLSRVV